MSKKNDVSIDELKALMAEMRALLDGDNKAEDVPADEKLDQPTNRPDEVTTDVVDEKVESKQITESALADIAKMSDIDKEALDLFVQDFAETVIESFESLVGDIALTDMQQSRLIELVEKVTFKCFDVKVVAPLVRAFIESQSDAEDEEDIFDDEEV